MAIALVTGSGQTIDHVGSPVTPLTSDAGYVLSTDTPGMSILKNTAAPLDQPNTIKYSVTSVSDMFKNTDLTAIEGQQGVQGINYLVQVLESWAMRDGIADPVALLPVSAHVVLKLPLHSAVTAVAVHGLIQRLLGAIVGQGGANLADGLAPTIAGITRRV